MSKINKILLVLVIILIVALSGVIYWQKGGFDSPYYAVYLSTGDIYFGKFSRFSREAMTDVWFLQRTDNQQNPFTLSKFENAFWGPLDKVYLNQKNVIWTVELKDDSQIVKIAKDPKAAASLGQMMQQQAPMPQQNPNSTSTPLVNSPTKKK